LSRAKPADTRLNVWRRLDFSEMRGHG